MAGLAEAGAWAQFAAVPAARLAAIPDEVTDVQAATLPTAGMTALRSLEVAGLLLGKRMLVTGATGGVGGIAVQVEFEGSWREPGVAIDALLRRRIGGKAVLHVD